MPLNPADAGNGSFSQTSRLGANQGFAPTPSQGPALQVNQPLNSTVRQPTGAETLAAALGLAQKVGQPIVDHINAQDAQQGAIDNSLNQVDPKKYAENHNYARAAFQNEADRQTMSFMQDWNAHYQNDIDKSAPPAAVAADFDTKAKAALGHFLGDTTAASVIAPKLQAFLEKKTGEHIQAQADERENAAVSTVGASIAQDMSDAGTTDFNKQFQQLAPIIGATKAKLLVTQSIIHNGIKNGAPEQISTSIPADLFTSDGTRLPGPSQDPALGEMVRNGIETAQGEKKKQESFVKDAFRSRLETGYDDRINNKQWLTKPELFAQQKVENLSEGEVVSWWDKSERARLAAKQQSSIADSGLPLWSLDLEPKERTDALKSRVDQEAGRNGGDQVAAAVKVMQRDGFPDPRIVTALTNVPPTLPAQFDQAAQMYSKIPPNLRDKFVENEERRMAFERYNQLRASGSPSDAAAKEIADFSPEIAKQNRERVFKQTGDAVQSISSQPLDTGVFLGFGKTTVADLANSTSTASRIETKTKMLIERGAVPQDAVKAATQDVLNESTLIKLSTGKSLLMPTPNAAPPDFNKAMQTAYDKIGDYVKADPTAAKGVNTEDLRFSYSPTGDNTRLILQDKDGIPVSSRTYSVKDIYENYQKTPAKAGFRLTAQQANAQLIENRKNRDRLTAEGLFPSGGPIN